MPVPLFNIIVCGVRNGFDSALVKTKFAVLFKLDSVKTERVFKSTPIVLRRNLNERIANIFVNQLLAIGVAAYKVNVDQIDAQTASLEKADPKKQNPEQVKPEKVKPEQVKPEKESSSKANVEKENVEKTRINKANPKVTNRAPLISKAIHWQDNGETYTDACAMHQSVDFLYGEHQRRIPFIFNGNGLAYCKLWLVNVLVCLLSAGILYPWARARTLHYFYQHTFLDYIKFQYQAVSPKVYFLQYALMGYIFALGCSFFYSHIYFFVGAILLLGFLPYYWFKRNQLEQGGASYRNLSFRQNISLRDAYINLLVWPVLIVLTAGLLAPYAAFKIQHARIDKKSIGNCEFTFSANPKKYLALLPTLLVAEILVFTCTYWRSHLSIYVFVAVIIVAALAVFIHWRVVLVNAQWNNIHSRLGYFVCSWDVLSYAKLALHNLILCMLSAGLYWPWAKINTAKYKAEHLAFFANQRFNKWQKEI